MPKYREYSARVDLYVELNGARLPASEVGEDSVRLREFQEIRPDTVVDVVSVVDGSPCTNTVVVSSQVGQTHLFCAAGQ